MDQKELLRERVGQLRAAGRKSMVLDRQPSVRSTGLLRGLRRSR